MSQFLVIRIGRYYFAIPSKNVRRAMPVLPHQPLPLLKPMVLGLVFYNKRFICKIALDSLLELGLYKSFTEMNSDATLIIETNRQTFCATVNDVENIVNINSAEILPVDKSPELANEIFPNKTYLNGYFELEHKFVYILDIAQVYLNCFE